MAERFYDKFGFQMMQQNQAFMRCPHDFKGVFFELRIMAGNSEHEDGTIPVGAKDRATRSDLIDYLTDYDRSKRNYFEKVFKRLEAVGVIDFYGKNETARIPFYADEQALGRTVDVNRKRTKARADLLEMVNEAGSKLRQLFRRSNATGLPHEILVKYLMDEFGCYSPKANEILNRMSERGVLYVRDDGLSTLATLAPPPGSGSAGSGSGAEFTATRKIPLESESDSESEEEGANAPSAGSAGARPHGLDRPHGSHASGSGGGGASVASGRSRPIGGGRDSPCMHSPEDAWNVVDPLQAVEGFLCTRDGWSEHGDERGPPSKYALRARWRDLRKAVGVTDAERIWRQALFDICMDHCDGQSWRSWVAGFLMKLDIARKAHESLKGVGDEPQ